MEIQILVSGIDSRGEFIINFDDIDEAIEYLEQKREENDNTKGIEIEAGYECHECGKVMESDKTYCSDDCFKASQL